MRANSRWRSSLCKRRPVSRKRGKWKDAFSIKSESWLVLMPNAKKLWRRESKSCLVD
jgi:hypothetical protein